MVHVSPLVQSMTFTMPPSAAKPDLRWPVTLNMEIVLPLICPVAPPCPKDDDSALALPPLCVSWMAWLVFFVM